jgi:hypothetical protein
MIQMLIKIIGGMLVMQLLYLSSAYAQQPEECARQAELAASDSSDARLDIGSGMASGAVVGAIVGDSSRYAGWGAFIGGIVGASHHSSQKEDDYDRAYRRCMYGLERMR